MNALQRINSMIVISLIITFISDSSAESIRYGININKEALEMGTVGSIETTLEPESTVSLYRGTASDDELVWCSENAIFELNSDGSFDSIPLTNHGVNATSWGMSKNGDTIAYVINDTGFQVYSRRRINGNWGTPQILSHTKSPSTILDSSICDVSDDGKIVLWLENDASGFDRLQSAHDNATGWTMPIEVVCVRALGFENHLSGNGNWAFFFVRDSGDGKINRTSVFSYFDGDRWSEPKPMTVDGVEVKGIVNDVNLDASVVQFSTRVLKRTGTVFSTWWQFIPPKTYFQTPQMSEDGTIVVFLSSDPDPGIAFGLEERLSNDFPSSIQTLTIGSFDGSELANSYGNTYIVAEGRNILFHLSNHGERLVYEIDSLSEVKK